MIRERLDVFMCTLPPLPCLRLPCLFSLSSKHAVATLLTRFTHFVLLKICKIALSPGFLAEVCFLAELSFAGIFRIVVDSPARIGAKGSVEMLARKRGEITAAKNALAKPFSAL
jgi:hypothetical protein